MSEVFNAYAGYYDLLYGDKDYAAEASFVDGLIRRYKKNARAVLDLGCGTGRHDACFDRLGYMVSGIDSSKAMLREARKRAAPGRIDFYEGDIRVIDLHRKFDVVTSLFHVMSYQKKDEDVAAAFRTAGRHLDPGGIFIFDFWHGQGVLNDPPVVRVKRFEDESTRIVRVAEPTLKPEQNVVDVNYQIFTLDKPSGRWDELRETHSMRYFFLPEVSRCLIDADFELLEASEWMSGRSLSTGWDGLVVARYAA